MCARRSFAPTVKSRPDVDCVRCATENVPILKRNIVQGLRKRRMYAMAVTMNKAVSCERNTILPELPSSNIRAG